MKDFRSYRPPRNTKLDDELRCCRCIEHLRDVAAAAAFHGTTPCITRLTPPSHGDRAWPQSIDIIKSKSVY